MGLTSTGIALIVRTRQSVRANASRPIADRTEIYWISDIESVDGVQSRILKIVVAELLP